MTQKTKRPVCGDVYELPLPNGYGYIQYVGDYKKTTPYLGPLVRVLCVHYDRPTTNFDAFSDPDGTFVIFFPLGAAVRRGIVRPVCRIEVPPQFTVCPLFKARGASDNSTGEVKLWWLWDGTDEWREAPLEMEHFDLPLRGIANDTQIIDWIETGWRPRDEVFRNRPDLKLAYQKWSSTLRRQTKK